jgi:glycosyltransferase involved in cell wall biosynthesis
MEIGSVHRQLGDRPSCPAGSGRSLVVAQAAAPQYPSDTHDDSDRGGPMTASRNKASGLTAYGRRLVIVVRADPVTCGHSGEARNLAEVALQRDFTDVRIITWPLDLLARSGLPLKPLDGVLPYTKGIEVERPEPVGDYKVPDGRYLAGMTGRLVELFTDGVPTVCMSLYLSPHTLAVSEALRVARSTGLPVPVTTVAEAVGSDVTNVVRSCAGDGRFGAAAQVLSAYLDSDLPVAVSDYTRELIISSAEEIDVRHGTSFGERCRQRVAISYPAINTADYLGICPEQTSAVLNRRGLMRDGYVLYLSRLAQAKGVDDLITGFVASQACKELTLMIAGNGPEARHLRELAAMTPAADRISFHDDVDDDEKPHLMAGCAAFVLPSKPRPEFVETFGIALVEKMLAGGGPVITTTTGGIGEAVGDTAMIVPVDSPNSIANALDVAVTMPSSEQTRMAKRAREHALQFDRARVFDRLVERLSDATDRELSLI